MLELMLMNYEQEPKYNWEGYVIFVAIMISLVGGAMVKQIFRKKGLQRQREHELRIGAASLEEKL